jgi:hypothetical protein
MTPNQPLWRGVGSGAGVARRQTTDDDGLQIRGLQESATEHDVEVELSADNLTICHIPAAKDEDPPDPQCSAGVSRWSGKPQID